MKQKSDYEWVQRHMKKRKKEQEKKHSEVASEK